MGFSITQYEAAINKIDVGLNKLGEKLEELPPSIQKAQSHWYLPGWLKSFFAWQGRELLKLGKWLLNKSIELLKGAAAPILFYKYSYDWEGIHGKATDVQGSVKPSVLAIPRTWEGSADSDYVKAIVPQPDAAGRVAALSDKVSMSLALCASAGLAFYIALGVIIYQFIETIAAAIAALCSGIFSWAGFAAGAADSGVTAGMIWAAISALGVVMGAQAQQMASIKGDASDNNAFPGGHWPKATA